MRIFRLLALPVLLVLAGFVLETSSASAADMNFEVTPDLPPLEVGTTIEFSLTITFTEAELIEFESTQTNFYILDSYVSGAVHSPIVNGQSIATHTYALTQNDLNACIADPAGTLTLYTGSRGFLAGTDGWTRGLGGTRLDIPCTVAAYPNIDLIQQQRVCGAPDELVQTGNQPAGVLVDLGTWVDSQRVVTFTAAPGYTIMGTSSYTFTNSLPCETDAPVPPVQTELCGANNDTITTQETQPAGISLASDTQWANNTRTITFAVDPAYTTTGQTTFTFTDAATACSTPDGSASPTPAEIPKASPTVVATQEIPVETPAAVTSLPNTGTGPGYSGVALGLGFLLMLIGIAATTRSTDCRH